MSNKIGEEMMEKGLKQSIYGRKSKKKQRKEKEKRKDEEILNCKKKKRK